MDLTYLKLIIITPAIILSIIIAVTIFRNKLNEPSNIKGVVMFVLIPLVNLFFFIYFYKDSNLMRIIMIILSYVAIISTFILFFVITKYYENSVRLEFFFLSLITTVSAIIVVAAPFLIIAKPLQQKPLTTKIEKIPDFLSIKMSLDTIRNSFSYMNKKVNLEIKNVDDIVETVLQNIETKQKELNTITKSIEKMSKEIEHYRHISSLSKEQAKAVNLSLQRFRYIDYIIGFVIGLFSSFLASVFARRLQLLRKNKTL